MVTPVTPQANEPAMARYLELYSEYMSMVIDIHNYNATFLKFARVRDEEVMNMRRLYKRMRHLSHELWQASLEADHEHWKLHPKKSGPVKKNKDVEVPGRKRGRPAR